MILGKLKDRASQFWVSEKAWNPAGRPGYWNKLVYVIFGSNLHAFDIIGVGEILIPNIGRVDKDSWAKEPRRYNTMTPNLQE